MVYAQEWAGASGVVTSVDTMAMYAVGMGTGEVNAMVCDVVSVVYDFSCSALLQIRSCQQRPNS